MDILNKIALVTGSSSGIGEGTTKSLIAEGYFVFGIGLEENHIYKHDKYQYYRVDVRNYSEIESVIGIIKEQFGKLDLLINCAGICGFSETLEHTSTERFMDIFAVDVFGVYNTIKASIELLKASPIANIISISSTLGIKHTPGSIAYGPAKAAINKLTKNLAVEYGGKIRVNAIAPSLIKTPMTEECCDYSLNEARKKIVQSYPMKRSGTIEEVVNAVMFLSSEKSSFITGEIMLVSGGGH